jgi:hypothetical protein
MPQKRREHCRVYTVYRPKITIKIISQWRSSQFIKLTCGYFATLRKLLSYFTILCKLGRHGCALKWPNQATHTPLISNSIKVWLTLYDLHKMFIYGQRGIYYGSIKLRIRTAQQPNITNQHSVQVHIPRHRETWLPGKECFFLAKRI